MFEKILFEIFLFTLKYSINTIADKVSIPKLADIF